MSEQQAKLILKPIMDRLENISKGINEINEQLQPLTKILEGVLNKMDKSKDIANIPLPSESKNEITETNPLNIDGLNLKVSDIKVLDNSYLVTKEDGLIAFIGKSLVDTINLNNNIITLKNTSKWLLENKKDGTPNIQWQEDTSQN